MLRIHAALAWKLAASNSGATGAFPIVFGRLRVSMNGEERNLSPPGIGPRACARTRDWDGTSWSLGPKAAAPPKDSIGEAAGRALDMHTPPTQVKCGLELQLF